MEHYVTLFNNTFLPQGIALHASLERHCKPYTLWILCMDDETLNVLQKLELPDVKLMALQEYETVELRKVKPSRTIGEYCWTLTPFVPEFVFDSDTSVERVTYLDTDVWFIKNPSAIFKEFEASGKKVLITSHGYAPEYDQSKDSGIYCVQFISFNRNGSEIVREWWKQRCIEWCFNRFETGKFGDQKYLDDWLERFPNEVHCLSDPGWTLAPWNATRFPYQDAIIYHFQDIRPIKPKELMRDIFYSVPHIIFKKIYKPYLDALQSAHEMMIRVGYQSGYNYKRIGLYLSLAWFKQGCRMKAGRFLKWIRRHNIIS